MFERSWHAIEQWFKGVDYSTLGWELLFLLFAVIGAVLVHRTLGSFLLKSSSDADIRNFKRITMRSIQRIIFPLSVLLGAQVGYAILDHYGMQVVLLKFAVPLMLSLAVIRLAVYVLRMALQPGPVVKAWETLISTTVWCLVALHLLGWLPKVEKALDAIGYSFGGIRVSILTVLQLLLLIGLMLIVVAWVSRITENALAKSEYVSAGMKVGLSKTLRFALYTLAALISLNAVGINLGALAVFGGALGVGLGFGLQRIASNFISGFILVFDRSISPGDVISVGSKFGWVQELRARYIVVRDRDGIETLIPNETLITTEVINWSYSDRKVRLKLEVQISYDDDPEQAMELMLQAANSCDRVLGNPPPAARLMNFGDNGIELELRVWIRDPEQGVAAVRSDVNVAIWKKFKEQSITIPFPQRDLHVKALPDVPQPGGHR